MLRRVRSRTASAAKLQSSPIQQGPTQSRNTRIYGVITKCGLLCGRCSRDGLHIMCGPAGNVIDGNCCGDLQAGAIRLRGGSLDRRLKIGGQQLASRAVATRHSRDIVLRPTEIISSLPPAAPQKSQHLSRLLTPQRPALEESKQVASQKVPDQAKKSALVL